MPPPPTRRGALTGLAGLAGLAGLSGLAACDRAVRPRGAADIELEVALSSDHLGHRLRDAGRDGLRVDPPADAWTSTRVAIIGGGVAGLSAARALRQAGIEDFVVLELEPAVGGTARGGKTDISPHPWGAHYTNLPRAENADYVDFLTTAGIVVGRDQHGEPIPDEACVCRDPDERCFYQGRWSEGLLPPGVLTVEDTRQLAAFDAEVNQLSALRDGRGRRIFTLPRGLGSDDASVASLDRESFADYLSRRGWNAPALRWQADYACRDDFGAHPADTSAFAGLHYFASRRQPDGESAAVLTWPEGNGRLIAHLLGSLRPETVRTGVMVADVAPVSGGVEIRALADGGERAVGIRAQHAILAVPQVFAAHLLRPYRDAPPGHLSAFTYGPWLVANLEMDVRPGARGFPLSWDNVLWDSGALGYICATHQSGLDYGPTILTWYEALADTDANAARRALLSWDAPTLRDRVLTDLHAAHPELPGRVRKMSFARHGHAMIRPRPGFLFSAALAQAARPVQNVHFAHTDLSGLALFEEAFAQGRRAAGEVVSALRG